MTENRGHTKALRTLVSILAVKVGYDINERWAVTCGYRTVEGGADNEEVYNFPWFQYAVVSGVFRF